jgi:cation diffusion facilitator family transporter
MNHRSTGSSHPHASESHGARPHTHGAIDPSIATSARGIWALKWSLVLLALTAVMQVVIVYVSGSIALLADTIHNFGDAATAIPLWIAFAFATRKPSKRFTYGYGRVEDLAGAAIVLMILLSAVVAGYESVVRLLHPAVLRNIGAVAAAAIIGFVGNEVVAILRIRVGNEIGSAALVADGHHARVDGLTSLAVLASAIGVWLGFPLADPFVGLLITIAILKIVWDSAKLVFVRLLDGVDPEVVDEIAHAARHVEPVTGVSDVRVRWLGHQMHAEVNLSVDSTLSIAEAHRVAVEARHEILHQIPYLSNALVHVDPNEASGEHSHTVELHSHSGLEAHSHK